MRQYISNILLSKFNILKKLCLQCLYRRKTSFFSVIMQKFYDHFFAINIFIEIKDKKKEGGFMKKYINYAFSYAVSAMIGGVFYREFTKLNGFVGKTTLGIVHVHLFVLGTILILLLGIFCALTNLEEIKQFKTFWRLYNLALPFMVIMFIVRGIVQVLGIELAKGPNAAISGIAGISHIFVAIALVMLFVALKKRYANKLGVE